MTPVAWLTTERDWPWRDGDLLGWPGLAAVAAVLVLLTLWTYHGQRTIGWSKVLAVLGLRLAALAVTAMLLLRPSFANEREVVSSGKLLVVLDYSLSMKIMDGPNNLPRWDVVRQLFEWPEVKDALQKLQKDRQIDVLFYQGAEDLQTYNPTGEAEGTRTDIGQWLHALMIQHRSDRNLRGILIFSDGADNGTRYLAVEEAAQWRGLSCPIHTFAAGLETTKKGQRDIAVSDVKANPERVFVKQPVKITATIDAPSMEGQVVTVRLLVDGKQTSAKEVTLPNTKGNIVDVGEVVPEQVGELKVTVKVDEVPGEFTKLNNELSTYVTVEKKGLTVLWVEGRKRLEATWVIRRVLGKDPRFNVVYDERPPNLPLTPDQRLYFTTPEKTFDVVVIGDIDAERFCGGDRKLLELLRGQVASGRTGLVMLGGFKTFANSDWHTFGKPLADLLPVELNDPGQVPEKIAPVPIAAGKGHRLLQLDEPVGKDLWTEVFQPLSGMAKVGKARPNADVLLATAETGGDPVFVVTKEGENRVAAFGGDTTYTAWNRSEEAVHAYDRFWSQLLAWLARQEKGDNHLWVKLDKRRLAAGARQKLGFTVGMVGKDGGPVTNPRFTVTVMGPGGEAADVKVRPQAGEYRGEFDQAHGVGEYKVQVKATGKGSDKVDFQVGPVDARFTAFSEDVENQRPAADHKFLQRLAAAGGGSARLAGKEELLQFLGELNERSASAGWVKRDVWPNWKYAPVSESLSDQVAAVVASGMLPSFVLFVGLVGTEWYLRRRWGLV